MNELVPGWVRQNGFIDLRDRLTVGSTDVADRLEIMNILGRYAMAYDERDLNALSDVFTADAVWWGSVTNTVAIDAIEGRDAIVNWLHAHMESQRDQRRHNLVNVVIVEQSADTARALSYLLLTSADGAGVRVVTTGVYDTVLVKEPSGWRIDRFFAGFDAPF